MYDIENSFRENYRRTKITLPTMMESGAQNFLACHEAFNHTYSAPFTKYDHAIPKRCVMREASWSFWSIGLKGFTNVPILDA